MLYFKYSQNQLQFSEQLATSNSRLSNHNIILLMNSGNEALRQSLLQYFMAISEAQEEIQCIQNQLVLLPFFNPLALYARIGNIKPAELTSRPPKIMCSDFVSYLMKKTKIQSSLAISTYLYKHQLVQSFGWQEFIQTILPYTPDVLRSMNSTIVWQVISMNSIPKQIQKLYGDMVKTQIFHMQKISALIEMNFRNNNWNDCRKLINSDINQFSDILYKRTKIQSETLDITQIRKWIQLWLDVQEKQILNILRWIKAKDETNFRDDFETMRARQNICCSCQISGYKYEKEGLRKESRQGYRRESRQDCRRESRQDYKNRSKESVDHKLRKSKSNFLTSQKVSDKRKSIKKKKKNEKQNQEIEIWFEYVLTILKSETVISQCRGLLSKHIEETERILKTDVLSKKKNATSISKLLQFIDKSRVLQKTEKKQLYNKIGHLSIENQVVFKIFTCQRQICQQKQTQRNLFNPLAGQQIRFQIANVLKIYCTTKAKLIELSQVIVSMKYGQKIFDFLNVGANKYISKKGIECILEEMGINSNLWQKQVLMGHFGDGTIITKMSFLRVFELQAKL